MRNPVEIDDDTNGEHADFLVCMRLTSPLLMPDNQLDICTECGEAIQYRPHVPKQPRKVCMECVAPVAAKAAQKGELHSIITTETAAELDVYLRRKGAN